MLFTPQMNILDYPIFIMELKQYRIFINSTVNTYLRFTKNKSDAIPSAKNLPDLVVR